MSFIQNMSWIKHAPKSLKNVAFRITVVSDSLFEQTQTDPHPVADKSGKVALSLLKNNQINNVDISYIEDNQTKIKDQIMNETHTHVHIFIGGTGIATRDFTFEAIQGVIEKEIFGFGEEFRRKSVEEIGAFGMLSRAIAGTYKHSLVIGIPGSPNATELGINLLLSFAGHALNLLK